MAEVQYFSVSHALDCRRGGLVTQQINEVRTVWGDLAALAYKDVIHEPVVHHGGVDSPAFITHLGVRCVWLPQTDIRVADVDAPSYVHCSVADVLTTAKVEKRELLLRSVMHLFR